MAFYDLSCTCSSLFRTEAYVSGFEILTKTIQVTRVINFHALSVCIVIFARKCAKLYMTTAYN